MSGASQLVLSTTSLGPIQVFPGSNGASQTVQAKNAGTGSLILTARPVNVVATAPIALIWPASVTAGAYGIVVNTDYSLVLPSPVTGFTTHPAKPGDTITIYCEGPGQTNPPAVTGAAASSTNLEEIANVTVTFGAAIAGNPVTVPVAFAGLTPTAVGLYQVDVTIPANTPTGPAIPVTINVSGVSGNAANIAIQ